MSKPRKALAPLLLLGAGLLSGCAAMNNHDELEKAIARAQATADDALRQARAANMKAEEALALIRGEADDPSATVSTRGIAEQALKEAKEAKAEAAKVEKKAERMFRKALAK